MKSRIVQFILSGFTIVILIISAGLILESAISLIGGDGVDKAYALGKRRRRDAGITPSQNKPFCVPEPSTLVLLGTGLAAAGGMYTMVRYRRRNRKK